MPSRPTHPNAQSPMAPIAVPRQPAGTETKPRSAGSRVLRGSRSPIETRSPHPVVRSFLLYLASERGLAENSLHAYRRDLEDLGDYFASVHHDFSSAKVDDYHGYIQDLSLRHKSTRTVSRRLACIRIFLGFLSARGHDSGPILQELERPKPEQSLPRVLSRAQVNQLIAAPPTSSPLFARDVAILELLYASGLRATELCELKLRDTNLQVGCVRVLGKGMKERIVPLGRAAAEAVARYLLECRPRLEKTPSDLLFLSRSGKPLERVGLWMLIEKYGRSSGLLNRVSPHTLRHCFATHLIGGGADLRVVQELLGHSDISTTQVYTHVDQGRLKAIHQKFHPRK